MLNVFSNDVHKIILENIENDKPLNYIQNYELEYHEGLPEKLEKVLRAKSQNRYMPLVLITFLINIQKYLKK